MLETASTTYSCPNCGAYVDFPAELLSTQCAFCDSPLVQEDRGAKPPPGFIAKFVLDRGQAGGKLRAYFKQAWFLPKDLEKNARPEELKGVYVPFWAIDAVARTHYETQVGIHWYEQETYTVVENGERVTKTRTVQRTDWHPLSGSYARHYRNHLVCGSKGIPEEETNRLEPFDLGRCLEYEPAHVAGWLAEHFTVDVEKGAVTAIEEIRAEQGARLPGFLPGDCYRGLNWSSEIEPEGSRSVLLPIWIATYRHKGEAFRLLVNGQTGSVTGSLPKDRLQPVLLAMAALLLLVVLGWLAGGV